MLPKDGGLLSVALPCSEVCKRGGTSPAGAWVSLVDGFEERCAGLRKSVLNEPCTSLKPS